MSHDLIESRTAPSAAFPASAGGVTASPHARQGRGAWVRPLMRGCVVAAAAALCTPASAAIVNKFNGVVTSVSGILLDDESWDVRFSDTSCALAFTGCDQSADFPFSNLDKGLALMNALLNQAVRLNPYDAFSIQGCGDPLRCFAVSPYDVEVVNGMTLVRSVYLSVALSYEGYRFSVADNPLRFRPGTSGASSTADSLAIWRRSVIGGVGGGGAVPDDPPDIPGGVGGGGAGGLAPVPTSVPEPSALSLVALTLGALGMRRRRRHPRT